MSPYAPYEPTPDDAHSQPWEEWDSERAERLRQAIGADLDDWLDRCVAVKTIMENDEDHNHHL